MKSLSDLFILTFLFVIGLSFYRFYYQKDYDYLVEASCNPTAENCFTRDCTNPEDCPPNGLSVYRQYYIKAYDFPRCEDNSCVDACASGEIKCQMVFCNEEVGDVCLGSSMGIE